MLTPSDWQEFRSARQSVLQNNPDLNTEYKSILQELQDQQTALEQAMIKADPNVVPILAKLAAMRQHSLAAMPPGGVPGPR